MFKVKYKYDGEIYTVLSVRYDEYYHDTRFFMWVDNQWKWVRADNFIPPNVEIEKRAFTDIEMAIEYIPGTNYIQCLDDKRFGVGTGKIQPLYHKSST